MKLKKPKFWDYKKPNLYAILFWPISILIQLFIRINLKKNKKNFKIKTICVGNIYVGGTGKTSLCIKINELLKNQKINSCFVKKYYKEQIDEQKLLKNHGKLFLSKKRIQAIQDANNEKYEIALLDDGLQDKSIECDIKIVCFNNINWIGNGMTIPSGPLRENIVNLKKYKNIFLNGNLENLENLKEEILKINPDLNIFLGNYIPINLKDFNLNENYFAFSGIGNHRTFISMLKKNGFKILKELEFPDHFQYKTNDISKIINEAEKSNLKIITTEKDFLRITNINLNKIQFIKSELKILDEKKFLKVIL